MTRVSVSLTLNDEERQLLQEMLEEQHRTLLMEISHADHYEFKTLLRKKAEIVESVLSRFAA
jgi:vacuolar-type H+-ATPase subunit E/Vma4